MSKINYKPLLEDIAKEIAPQYEKELVIKQLNGIPPINEKDHSRADNYECIFEHNKIIFAVKTELYDRAHLYRKSGRDVRGNGLSCLLYKEEFKEIVSKYLDQFCKNNNIQESWLMFNKPDNLEGINARIKEYY